MPLLLLGHVVTKSQRVLDDLYVSVYYRFNAIEQASRGDCAVEMDCLHCLESVMNYTAFPSSHSHVNFALLKLFCIFRYMGRVYRLSSASMSVSSFWCRVQGTSAK